MNQKRLLIIEDDSKWYEMAKIKFIAKEYDLTIIEDGFIISDMIKDNKFYPENYDAVLLDLNLGGIRGEFLLMEFNKKKITEKLPIIIWTVNTEKFRELRKYGAYEYIIKSTDGWEDLYQRVELAIEKFNNLKKLQEFEEIENINKYFQPIIGHNNELKILVKHISLLNNYKNIPKDARPRGSVLIGPTGVGKSATIKCFKNIDGITSHEFNTGFIFKPFAGDTSKIINDEFEKAKSDYFNTKKSQVIIIDEISPLISKYSVKENKVQEELHTAFINALDDVWDNEKPIYCIGTTNLNEEEIDIPFQSRFKIIIYKELTKEQIVEILKRMIQNVPSQNQPANFNYYEVCELLLDIKDTRDIYKDLLQDIWEAITNNASIIIDEKVIKEFLDRLNIEKNGKRKNIIKSTKNILEDETNIAQVNECNKLDFLRKTISYYNKYGTDINKTGTKSLKGYLKNRLKIEITKSNDYPFLSEYRIMNAQEEKKFREELTEIIPNINLEDNPVYLAYKNKIERVVKCAEALLEARKSNKPLTDIIKVNQNYIGLDYKKITDRIDLLTLKLLRIIEN